MSPRALYRLAVLLAAVASACACLACYAVAARADVYLNRPVWSAATKPERCHVWIHERGHNAGFEHGVGVMAPTYPPITKTCRRWRGKGVQALEAKAHRFWTVGQGIALPPLVLHWYRTYEQCVTLISSPWWKPTEAECAEATGWGDIGA